jgi:hypothetical protein
MPTSVISLSSSDVPPTIEISCHQITQHKYLCSYEEDLFLNVMNTSADNSKSHTRENIRIVTLPRIKCPTIKCDRRKWRPTSKNTPSL